MRGRRRWQRPRHRSEGRRCWREGAQGGGAATAAAAGRLVRRQRGPARAAPPHPRWQRRGYDAGDCGVGSRCCCGQRLHAPEPGGRAGQVGKKDPDTPFKFRVLRDLPTQDREGGGRAAIVGPSAWPAASSFAAASPMPPAGEARPTSRPCASPPPHQGRRPYARRRSPLLIRGPAAGAEQQQRQCGRASGGPAGPCSLRAQGLGQQPKG